MLRRSSSPAGRRMRASWRPAKSGRRLRQSRGVVGIGAGEPGSMIRIITRSSTIVDAMPRPRRGSSTSAGKHRSAHDEERRYRCAGEPAARRLRRTGRRAIRRSGRRSTLRIAAIFELEGLPVPSNETIRAALLSCSVRATTQKRRESSRCSSAASGRTLFGGSERSPTEEASNEGHPAGPDAPIQRSGDP